MKHYLLNHQPQKGLQAVCAQQGQAPTCNARGKGHTSASPKTLTRILLVLLTMLLLPSAAWGQTNYPITVAGVQVTDANSTNITGTNITGTVSFDASTNTLTLDNARVTGTISSSIENLNINLKGFSLFTLDNESGIAVLIDYTGDTQTTSPKVTFKADKLGASLIAIGSQIEGDHHIYITLPSGYDTDTDANPRDDVWSIRQTPYNNASKKIVLVSKPYMIIHRAAYDFDIDDSYLDNTNENLPKIDWLSFTPATDNTQFMLKLKQSEENRDNGENTFISPITIQDGLSELVIDLDGNIGINTQYSNQTNIAPINSKNGGGTNIKFTSSTEGSLTLIRTSTGLLENVTPIYDTGWSATITAPQGVTNITQATEAIIAKPYDLSVAGIPVTSANAYNVLGDGKVSFTPAEGTTKATLTLNEATLEVSTEGGAAIESSLDNLIVYLVGDNTVQAQAGSQNITSFYAFKGNSNNTITFQTNVQEPGKIQGSVIQGSVSEPSVFNTVTLAYQEGLGLTRNGNNFEIGVIKYGLTIGETVVTALNADDVLGDGKVSFKPATVGADQESIPATLTLNGASIGQIKMTAAGNLTLHFVGENTITVENTDDYAIQGPGTTGTLEFSTSNDKTDILTIKGITESNNFAGSWYSKPRLTTNSADYDWVVRSETLGNIHHISKNKKYDLWLNGTRFCDANLDYDSGIAFNPETETPTLTYSHTDQNVIYSGLPSLTIKMGNSQLKAIVFGSPDTGQPITATSGNLSIVKYSDDSSVELEPFKLVGDGTNSVISGFTGVTYDDYLILEDGVSYNTESKQLENTSKEAAKSAVFVSATLEKPMMENFNGVLSIINNNSYDPNQDTSGDEIQIGTIKYSIEYSDGSEGVTDALFNESNAPTLDKAAIVTAYVQLNGVTSESATGKYLEAKQKVFGVAIGDKIEGTDWFTPSVSNDEVTFFFDGSKSNGIFEEENEKLIAKESGTGKVEVNYEGENILNNSPITLTINVGEELSDYFEVSNNFGTFYNTDQTTTYAVPEGMKAYVITGADPETGKVTTAETTVLPPNTPVLLEKGSAKAFNYIPATGTAPSDNILLYTGNTDVKATDGSNLYVLYNDKFVKVTTDTRILSQKCYLKLNTSAGTRGFYDIDGSDGTTAIKDVKSGEVDGEKWADDGWHDLQGRRLSAKPTKPGLYILNGKKVAIK